MAIKYLDAKRIRGSSTGNKQNYLRLRSTSDANYRASLDLQTKGGETVANTWVIRFTRKLTGGGSVNGGTIGTHISYAMTSTDYSVSPTGNSSQALLGFKQGDGDGGAIAATSATLFPAPDNWGFANSGGLDLSSFPNTYYFEIIRSGASGTDTLTANVYTTSDYSGSPYGTATRDASSATVRYFSLANYDNSSNQGLIEAEIRDFKFWNGDGSSVPSTSGTPTYTATFDTGEWGEQNNSKIGAGFYTSTDEKATLVTSADSGWTLNESGSGQTISGGYLETTVSSNGYKSVDFGTPTNFIFDFDWAFTGADPPESPFLILSSTNDGYGDVVEGDKRIFLYSPDSVGFRVTYKGWATGGSTQEVSDHETWSGTIGTKYYYRCKKVGTAITFSYWADSARAGTALQEVEITVDSSFASGTTDMIYLNVGAYGGGGDNKLYDYKYYDEQTSPTTVTFSDTFSPTSNLPENTIFEETDTRIPWWLQSGAWVYGGSYEAIVVGGAASGEAPFVNTYVSAGAAGGSWTAVADMPLTFWAGMGGGGKSTLIVAGGIKNTPPSHVELNTSYVFNGTSWSGNTAMNYTANGGKGGGSSTDAMICGGRSGSYNANTDLWNGSSWSSSGVMTVIRFKGGADGYSGDGIVAGGYSTSNALTADTDVFNGSTWSNAAANVSTAIYDQLITGGSSDALQTGGAPSGGAINTTQHFNGSTWVSGGNFSVADSGFSGGGGHGTSSSASGSTIKMGGLTGDRKTTEIYNGSAWTTKDDLAKGAGEPAVGVKNL